MKWTINTRNKIISLKKETFSQKIIGFFGFPKCTTNELYSFLMSRFDDADLMPFEIPMEADGNRKSKVHYSRYQLRNDWIINKKDLKHLTKGPLISQDGEKILVNKNPFCKALWEVIKGILWILGAILTIYGIYELINKFI